jgi:hypothetical protein
MNSALYFENWLLILEGQAEDQARAILSGDEKTLRQLSAISPEPKYLPIIAHFYLFDQPNIEALGQDFAAYKSLVDSKKLPIIQIKKFGATWDNKPVNYLQFSEKVHALQSQFAHREKRKKSEAEVTGATPIFNKNNIYVYEANSAEACVKLGKGYSFCIS